MMYICLGLKITSTVDIIIPPIKSILKRYLLFFGSPFYPVGEMNDLLGQFDSFEEAASALDEESVGSGDFWAHIYDTWEDKKILSYGQDSNPSENYLPEGLLSKNPLKLPEYRKGYTEGLKDVF
jgi:hypothetical protein